MQTKTRHGRHVRRRGLRPPRPMKGEAEPMDKFSLVLVIIGAINWLLIGLFQFDVVAAVLGGSASVWSRIVYSLVGLAGLWCISLLFRKRGSSSES